MRASRLHHPPGRSNGWYAVVMVFFYLVAGCLGYFATCSAQANGNAFGFEFDGWCLHNHVRPKNIQQNYRGGKHIARIQCADAHFWKYIELARREKQREHSAKWKLYAHK